MNPDDAPQDEWSLPPVQAGGGWDDSALPLGRSRGTDLDEADRGDFVVSPGRMAAAASVVVVSATLFIGLLGVPAATALTVGGTFVGITVLARILSMASEDAGGVVGWLADRSAALWDEWGTGFYGMASLTSFALREVGSISDSGFNLPDFLRDPIGQSISIFINQMIEGIMNAVWAALWWMDVIGFANSYGMYVAGAAVFAGWLFWYLLRFDEVEPQLLTSADVDGLAGLSELGDLGLTPPEPPTPPTPAEPPRPPRRDAPPTDRG